MNGFTVAFCTVVPQLLRLGHFKRIKIESLSSIQRISSFQEQASCVVHGRVQRCPRPCATLSTAVRNVVHGRVQRCPRPRITNYRGSGNANVRWDNGILRVCIRQLTVGNRVLNGRLVQRLCTHFLSLFAHSVHPCHPYYCTTTQHYGSEVR